MGGIMADWQTHLINKGFLYPDGKRVVKSLDNTVLEYVKFTQNVTSWRFIYEILLKPDGSKYSQKQCVKAVAYSNTSYFLTLIT
jgi:hypothetical protein